MNEAWLLWGLLFGAIGLGCFVYGKKQRRAVPFVCGLGLMIFPYFVSSTLMMIGVGVALILVCWFVRL